MGLQGLLMPTALGLKKDVSATLTLTLRTLPLRGKKRLDRRSWALIVACPLKGLVRNRACLESTDRPRASWSGLSQQAITR